MKLDCLVITGVNQAEQGELDIPDEDYAALQAEAETATQIAALKAVVETKKMAVKSAIAASIQAELTALKEATDTPPATVAQCVKVITALVRQNKKLLRAVALLMGNDAPDEG